MDPEAILAKVGLKPGSIFVDIACGHGYFAIPAARLVGPKGRVYGIDLDEEAIGALKERAAAEGLKNIKATVGNAESKAVCRACADVVIFSICLHDFENPAKALENARKALKPGGTLADLDWNEVKTEGGPPAGIRLSERKASQLIEEAGFGVKSAESISGRYYLVIAQSPPGK
jgi:ubiquinone/menaquinone biosynthesis C-methylase UbiE